MIIISNKRKTKTRPEKPNKGEEQLEGEGKQDKHEQT